VTYPCRDIRIRARVLLNMPQNPGIGAHRMAARHRKRHPVQTRECIKTGDDIDSSWLAGSGKLPALCALEVLVHF
jgi:hypothetical protein